MEKDQKNKEKVELGRRELLKKTAYVAPTLVVLGVLSPLTANAQSLDDLCPPGTPAGDPGCY